MHDVVLQAKGLDVFYGTSQVLFGVSFSIGQGEMATLLGRKVICAPFKSGLFSFRHRRRWELLKVC